MNMNTIYLPDDPIPTDEEAKACKQHHDWTLSQLDPANFATGAEKERAYASQQAMANIFISAEYSYRVEPAFLADCIAHIKGELTSDKVRTASLARALAKDRGPQPESPALLSRRPMTRRPAKVEPAIHSTFPKPSHQPNNNAKKIATRMAPIRKVVSPWSVG